MVKVIVKEDRVEVPEGVTLSVKSKVISVKGPRGELSRTFQTVPVQIIEETDASKRVVAVVVRVWFAKSKPKSCVTTICRHISNMIQGVTKGYKYVMKYGYNILPMQPTAVEGGKVLQVTNYLGEKYIRKIRAVRGVIVVTKDKAWELESLPAPKSLGNKSVQGFKARKSFWANSHPDPLPF